MYNCKYKLYKVQCPNITVTTDNGALTLLPALLHRGRNFLHLLFRKITKKYFFLKLLLLRPNHEFKVFVCFSSFNFPSDCCQPCLWFSSAGVTVADETLSFAEYIFNYPNYQISRCQNKSKYCPPCPPLRGRLEREIEPKKYKLIHAAFSFTLLSVKQSKKRKSH